MSLALLLALQAAPQAPAATPLQIDFDLARRKPADPCETGLGTGADIVVCGRRPGPGTFDLGKWERVFATERFLAETPIGRGAVARAYTESVGMNAGNISKRAMVGIRI